MDKIYEMKQIDIPKKDVIEAYYNQNKEKYKYMERRSFSFLSLDINNLSKKIDIKDDDIKKIYDERIDEFKTQEKRNVRQIVFDKEEDAISKYKLLNNKEINFEELEDKAKENNFEFIDFGSVTQNELLNEFSDEVFMLKENQITKPIKTVVGWHILKVYEIIEEKNKPFSEVKKILKKDLSLDKAYDEFDLIINEVDELLSKNISLEEISKNLDIELKKIDLLERKDIKNNKQLPKEFINEEFINELFNQEVGHDIFVNEINDGFYIYKLDDIVSETEKNFDESYKQVLNDWRTMKSKKNY